MSRKAKRSNPKPQGKCIFCEGPRLTHEHVWADWLKHYIPREKDEHYSLSTLVLPDKDNEVQEKRQTGDPHSRRLYKVCKPCNSGWMSTLQKEIKPILVPMLQHRPVTLYRAQQTKLAAWTAMMVMVAEYVFPDKLAIPQQQRVNLRDRQRAPAHWRVWIGEHKRMSHPLFTHNVIPFEDEKAEPAALDGVPDANTHTSTILLGKHLIIHVMAGEVPFSRRVVRAWQLPPKIGPRLSQIWPIKHTAVGWPGNNPLNDSEITVLAQEFFRAAENVGARRR